LNLEMVRKLIEGSLTPEDYVNSTFDKIEKFRNLNAFYLFRK